MADDGDPAVRVPDVLSALGLRPRALRRTRGSTPAQLSRTI
ncbi:hypothetical protein [Streptomyces ziwulingensis]